VKKESCWLWLDSYKVDQLAYVDVMGPISLTRLGGKIAHKNCMKFAVERIPLKDYSIVANGITISSI
jgi:hypothetical protein